MNYTLLTREKATTSTPKEKVVVDEKGDGDKDKEQHKEQIKILFQQFNAICRQLEVEIVKCKTVEDLFSSELLAKRIKLRDLVEKIIRESPSHIGLARDKFWKHGLYDVFTRAKYLKKNGEWTPLQLAYIRNHIQGGIGQLNGFLFKVKKTKEHSISPFLSDSLQNILNGGIGDCIQNLENENNDQESLKLAANDEKWKTDLFYSCMMNIGNLYRYLVDTYSKTEDPEIAEAYFYRAQDMYIQAFLLNPNNGMAHNNLGNLSLKLNCGIDSTYYLLYSMTCTTPFDGARSNLKQLLDKKLSEFARRPATIEPKLIELFSNSFLVLLQNLLFVEIRISNFDKIFTEVFESYNELITTNDPDVDGKFLFHISSITVIAIWKLTSWNSNNASSAIALALSIFFNGLTKIGSIIEQHSQIEIIDEEEMKLIIQEKEATLKESFSKLNVLQEEQATDADDSGNDDEKTMKLVDSSGILGYRRKLPTRRGSRSSDEEEYFEEEIDDFEEIVSLDNYNGESDEKDSDSEYNNDEIEDQHSQSSSQSQIDNKAFDSVSSSNNSQNNTDDKDKMTATGEFTLEDLPKQERFVINKEDLVKCWSQLENLFVAIFPFLKLLQNTDYVFKHVFAANCEKVVLKKLADTLNLLRRTDWMKILEDINVNVEKDWKLLINDPFMEDKDKRIFQFELPEDRSLYGLEPIKTTFEGLKRIQLNDNDKMLIRISRLLIFGHWLTEAESLSLLYSEEESSFYVPTPQDIDRHIRMVKMRELKNTNTGSKSKINIINKLTQLYQEMKVHEESCAKPIRRRGARNTRFTRGKRMDDSEALFVVVDLSAVLDYFSIVERLVHHFKFVVVLPYSVWITLDKLKDTEEKGSEEALTVFRWFEDAAKGKGDLNIRSQKEHETVPIDFEYPTNRKGREFFEMMGCCNFLLKSYFTDKRGRGNFFTDIRDKYQVFYLTGQPNLLKPDPEGKNAITFSTIGVSKGVGVFLDHISVYPPRKKRWRGKRSTITGHG